MPNALHDAIRGKHHQLDHHPLLAPLLRGPLSIKHYARALSALHGAQSAMETCAQNGMQRFGMDYPLLYRRDLLEADLATLGESPLPCRVAPLPRIDEIAELIGLLYVLEGSRMGASVIARCLSQSLPTISHQFFQATTGHAPMVAFWPFAHEHCHETKYPTAANYAAATFSFLLAHLEDCLAQTHSAPTPA